MQFSSTSILFPGIQHCNPSHASRTIIDCDYKGIQGWLKTSGVGVGMIHSVRTPIKDRITRLERIPSWWTISTHCSRMLLTPSKCQHEFCMQLYNARNKGKMHERSLVTGTCSAQVRTTSVHHRNVSVPWICSQFQCSFFLALLAIIRMREIFNVSSGCSCMIWKVSFNVH